METGRSLRETLWPNTRFNGAHRLSAMETPRLAVEGGNIAPLQWGHRLSAMETSSPPTRATRSTGCFNGATAFRRWKLASLAFIAWDLILLQWGHRLSAMETGR